MKKVFVDGHILEQDIVSVSESDGMITNGVSLVISTRHKNKVDAVELILTYEELKQVVAMLEKAREDEG